MNVKQGGPDQSFITAVLSSLMDPTGAEPRTTFYHSPQARDTRTSKETEQATCECITVIKRGGLTPPPIYDSQKDSTG